MNVQQSFNNQQFEALFRSPMMQQLLQLQSQQLSQSEQLYQQTFDGPTNGSQQMMGTSQPRRSEIDFQRASFLAPTEELLI